jgi:NADPH:quinone reductase
MRVVAHQPRLEIIDIPVPNPGAGEVRIRVDYAGVNRPDLLQRSGVYPPPPDASPYMGLEVSGTISAIGQGVSHLLVGQAVCALTPGGGYAEEVITPAGHCLPIPAGLSMAQAAVLPETYLTVWANLIERGGLIAGETVLIHGGSSGIGVTAIQMAKWRGATVITTVGSEEKAAFCKSLGADHVINYKTHDFQEVVKEITGGKGVHLILDMVGGPYIEKNLRSLALDGRLVQISFLLGSKVEMDWRYVMMRRLTITGSTLRARSVEDKAGLVQRLQAAIWPELAKGRLLPVIHAQFDLHDVEKAHALMESSAHIGKILLKVSHDKPNGSTH